MGTQRLLASNNPQAFSHTFYLLGVAGIDQLHARTHPAERDTCLGDHTVPIA